MGINGVDGVGIQKTKLVLLPGAPVPCPRAPWMFKVDTSPLAATELADCLIYRGRRNIARKVYILSQGGIFFGVSRFSQNHPILHTPITDKDRKLIGVIIGQNSEAPFILKVSGFVSDIKLIPRHKDKDDLPVDFSFPAEGGSHIYDQQYFLSAKDLEKLGIPGRECPLISCKFESGHPVAVYSPQDASYERPLYFRVVRDMNGEILTTARKLIDPQHLEGVKIIEGIETYIVETNPYWRENIAIQREFVLNYVNRQKVRERPLSRHVSILFAQGKYILFLVDAPQFDETAREIAIEAAKVFNSFPDNEKQEGVKKIREFARLAYQAFLDGERNDFRKRLSKLKALNPTPEITPFKLAKRIKAAKALLPPKDQRTSNLKERLSRLSEEVLVELGNQIFNLLDITLSHGSSCSSLGKKVILESFSLRSAIARELYHRDFSADDPRPHPALKKMLLRISRFNQNHEATSPQ